MLGEDEWCCGSVLLRTGQREQMERIVRHNVESLKATGAKVVTACTGCFKTLSTDYTEFYEGKLPFQVMHMTQYMAQELQREI